MNMAIHKNQNGPDGKLFEGLIKRLVGNLQLYKQYFMIQIKSTMQYKTSFFLTALGQFLASFNVFLGMYFMFQRFRNVRGYGYGEVLLCCGILPWRRHLQEGLTSFPPLLGMEPSTGLWCVPAVRCFRCWDSALSLRGWGVWYRL